MSFLAPAALGFLALLPGIVLLYFLKLRRKDELISSTYLWKKAIQDLHVNRPFQRLRKNLLLWLQLALVTLLVLGLSRPVSQKRGGAGRHVVCLVDTSASMAARDVRPDRLGAARDQARRLIDDLAADDQMMLIAFDVEPAVAQPFTRDKSRLREAVRALRTRETSTDFAAAVDLVRALAQDLSNVEVVLVSDGAFDARDLPDVPGASLTYVKIGAGAANAGITAIDARRSLDTWDQPQVFVRVNNFDSADLNTRIDLYLNDALFSAQVIQVPAGGSASKVFSDARLKEGLVKAVLAVDDDLAADNQAWLPLLEPRKVRTLVVTSGNLFLELAAQNDPFCAPTFVAPEQYDAGLKNGAFTAADFDLIVLDRHAPPSGPAAPSLPAGAYLVLGAVPPLERFRLEDRSDTPVVVDWDTVHPVNRYVNYANLSIRQALKIAAPTDARALVETNAGPLVYWWASPQYRMVVVGFDILESPWPLRIGFPVFFANVVRYLGGVQVSGENARIRPGAVINLNALLDVQEIGVTRPDGAHGSVPVRAGRATFADTARCGPYVFDLGRAGKQTYVVNLLDARETNTAPQAEAPWRKGAVAAAGRLPRENREYWPWLLLAAMAFLMLEWYIYNRRVYV